MLTMYISAQVSEHIREVGGVKAALTMFKGSNDNKIQERAAKLLSKLAVNSTIKFNSTESCRF